MEYPDIKSVLEALLLVSDVPLAPNRLREIMGRINVKDIQQAVEDLKNEYQQQHRSFTIIEVAGGFQLSTLPQYSEWIKKMYKGRLAARLSKPALETLAIIAFKQPITRHDVEMLRGVDVGGVLTTLLERNLVAISGRDNAPGKPLIYVTTKEFLRYFGLNKLSDLPRPKELEELLRQREQQQQELFPEETLAASPVPDDGETTVTTIPGEESPAATPDQALPGSLISILTKARNHQTLRLNKFLRDSGLASRRKCEELIRAGRIAVNGVPATRLATTVDPPRDRVTLDGRPLTNRVSFRSVLLYKPGSCLVSRSDPQHRPTVMDLLPPEYKTLFPVGRLDCHTEGVLLLTDDGELANRLLHPRYHVRKTYRCWLNGAPSPAVLKKLAQGVVLDDGIITLPALIKKVREDADRGSTVIDLTIREGRNRQVRRMCAALGLDLARLVRTVFAGITLDGVTKGAWRLLLPDEITRLQSITHYTVDPATTAGTPFAAHGPARGRRGDRKESCRL